VIDLDVFHNADKLAWTQWTVFEAHRSDDGTLFAWGKPITSNGVGMVWVDPATLDELHTAVRAWCEDQIGRVDVEFRQ
jgi:hypothetical protein